MKINKEKTGEEREALEFMSPPFIITNPGRFVYYLRRICTPVDRDGGRWAAPHRVEEEHNRLRGVGGSCYGRKRRKSFGPACLEVR